VEKSCLNCSHWQKFVWDISDANGNSTETLGACRRHAPIIAMAGTRQLPQWPQTLGSDRCGEFELNELTAQ
jgi:hypothetical protein